MEEVKEKVHLPSVEEKTPEVERDKSPSQENVPASQENKPNTMENNTAPQEEEADDETGNVYAKYYFNGKRLGDWTDRFDHPINNWGTTYEFLPALWKNWSDTYPADWEVRITVENNSNTPWENPYLSVWTKAGVEGESKDYFGKTLAPGESDVFVVPLSDFKLPALYKDKREQDMFFTLHATGGQVLFGEKTTITFILKNK